MAIGTVRATAVRATAALALLLGTRRSLALLSGFSSLALTRVVGQVACSALTQRRTARPLGAAGFVGAVGAVLLA